MTYHAATKNQTVIGAGMMLALSASEAGQA
jgi:hypothetical protein